MGGDEFLLILPGTGEKECRDFLVRLGRRWTEASDGDPAAVSISVGSASFPSQETTLAGLLRVADAAMYANKRRADVVREDDRLTPRPLPPEDPGVRAPTSTNDNAKDDAALPGARRRARLVSC